MAHFIIDIVADMPLCTIAQVRDVPDSFVSTAVCSFGYIQTVAIIDVPEWTPQVHAALIKELYDNELLFVDSLEEAMADYGPNGNYFVSLEDCVKHGMTPTVDTFNNALLFENYVHHDVPGGILIKSIYQ